MTKTQNDLQALLDQIAKLRSQLKRANAKKREQIGREIDRLYEVAQRGDD